MTLEKDVRNTLATHGVEVHLPLVSFPGYPLVLTDRSTVVVKLRTSRDSALEEVYWARILEKGGASVAPLLVHEVVPIANYSAVITRYLAPDRVTDERDAPAAGKIMRQVHDLAFEYAEPDRTTWTPHDSQPRNFVLHQGSLYLVDLNNVEQHTRESARAGAAGDFMRELPKHAEVQFLAAYDD